MNFSLDVLKVDFLLCAWEHQVPGAAVATALQLSEEAVARAFHDFSSKNRATAHLCEMAHAIAM